MSHAIKAFCVDFNWDILGRAASPGLFTHAEPQTHLDWYLSLGANTIQTFCVSFNGYAWFPSQTAPVNPGACQFLPRLTELAHGRGLTVLGYFCLGANPHWEKNHPDLVHHHPDTDFIKIPLTQTYLDTFCAMVQDAMQAVPIDGFLIDWFRTPNHAQWLDCEKQMYRQLMGESFGSAQTLPPETAIAFDRCVLDHAWRQIRAAAHAVRPTIIWTNHPCTHADDPLWTGHRLLAEADGVQNESPDDSLLNWLSAQVGPHTQVIQNLCGWAGHDASIWRRLDLTRYALYGFAHADPLTTLPAVRPIDRKNIEHIRQAYHSLP